MKIAVIGIQGKMGQVLKSLISNYPEIELFGISRSASESVYTSLGDCPKVDVICDFSNPNALETYLPFAIEHHIPCVIATTGYTDDQEKLIQDASQTIPIFKSSNFSYGVYVLNQLLVLGIKYLENDYDMDVVDAHHRFKKDAPSGTAKQLLNTINRNAKKSYHYGTDRDESTIPLHVIRSGNIVGDHSILFSNLVEQIEIKHHALSKSVFADGAIKACQFIVNQKKGFYTMEDLI